MKGSSKKNVNQATKEFDEEERNRAEENKRIREEEIRNKREELRELSQRKVVQKQAAEEGNF
jgi:hypothetical protein